MLYIGKAVRRFLHDENGPVESILIRCLKLKVGSGTVLEDAPAHQPPDESSFLLSEIIDGPLVVTPKGSKIFEVPQYDQIQEHFRQTLKLDRTKLNQN